MKGQAVALLVGPARSDLTDQASPVARPSPGRAIALLAGSDGPEFALRIAGALKDDMVALELDKTIQAASLGDLIFQPVPVRNAFEETVGRLTRIIKLGLVQTGASLPPERQLAPLLGVSRVTLREALRALEKAGFVESRRGRSGGTFVTFRPLGATSEQALRQAVREMGERDLRDALNFRRVVEPSAAELAAEHAVDHRTDHLVDLARIAAQAPPVNYRAADFRLHLAIAEVADCPSLSVAVREVQLRLTDLLASIPRLERAIIHGNQQHSMIVDAIGRGQPQQARAVMEEHISATAALLVGFLG